MLKDVAVGNHLIQVNGISPDNQVRSTTLPAIYEKAKSPITPTINNLVFVVPFSSNKYTLNNSQMAILKSVKQVKAAKIQVIGYAQPSSAQADIALSLDRALEVKKAVSKIVPKANFITRGSGPKSQPLCAKYKNKCVVVTITQG
jgi:outer membrane protein OmpA-like peptidoglycan-associated protein